MKILLTGATGYIGKRLLPLLLDQGHEVICCVRDPKRFPREGIYAHPNITLFTVDLLEAPPADTKVLKGIDVAYYLIHSMSSNERNFEALEERAARHFVQLMAGTGVRQVVYLGGIANTDRLSRHLASRRNVETILRESGLVVTAIRAGIIVGSGSASFEIIRDLVEKLPVMVTPRWLNTRSQPIGIRDVLQYLVGVQLREETFNRSFDIGGPEVLTYKQMLLQFAEVRGLRRFIYAVPVMTPRLSSYWLYFVTSTSYKLAVNLVNSMKVEVVAANNDLERLLGITPMTYRRAVEIAFERVRQDTVISSWKDSLISSDAKNSLLEHVDVPTEGCFLDRREKRIPSEPERVLSNVWAIGGERGWYYGDWLWHLRGFIDKLQGGVGLRRGRTSEHAIAVGDTLDFWRVLDADKANRRLLLFAEMKLPGEAWLEFKIVDRPDGSHLLQTATFRPKGLLGRLYWYSVLPFHFFLFEGMANNIIAYRAGARS